WNDFKALMVEEFCPSNEMEKLENEFWNHKMVGANHAAMSSGITRWYIAGLAPKIRGILTDEAVSCGTLTKGSDKRKGVEEPSKTGGSWKDNKREKMGRELDLWQQPHLETRLLDIIQGVPNGAVNTAHGVTTASTQATVVNSTIIDNLSDAVIYA
ncbi:hypothetical protein Tco_0326505, partial [Tanacetum coccineum]